MNAARISKLVRAPKLARVWEMASARLQPARGADTPRGVTFDAAAFLRNDPDARDWDADLADAIGARLVLHSILPVADRLRFVGLDTVDEVKRAWRRHRDVTRLQFVRRSGGEGRKTMGRGIALFHLAQVLAVRSGGVEALARLLAMREAPVHIADPGDITGIARVITDAITEVEASGDSRSAATSYCVRIPRFLIRRAR